MENQAIVRFQNAKKRLLVDIEVPLDISAEDLIRGLNTAYDLGIAEEHIPMSYLICEHPIVLVRGKDTLRFLGIRDGAILRFTL